MPVSCAPIRVPMRRPSGKGLGNTLMVNSQKKPARLLKTDKRAMKTTTRLSTGAFWIGLHTIRTLSKPPPNGMATVAKDAHQKGDQPRKSRQEQNVTNTHQQR